MRVEMAAMKRDAEHYSRQVISLIIQLFTFLFPRCSARVLLYVLILFSFYTVNLLIPCIKFLRFALEQHNLHTNLSI